MITQERLKELLHYNPETGVFTRNWTMGRKARVGSIAGSVRKDGYRQIQINKIKYLSHRLAWLYMTGSWPKEDIDHINRVKDDNRWENLREASPSQNQANRKININNSSGLKGVQYRKDNTKNPWQASIECNGKSIYLGYFRTPEEAYLSYCLAALVLFGKFARFK